MKSVRINLIKRSEVRYQGIVSPKFLVITCGSALIAALLLMIVVRGVQYTYRKKDLSDAREVWLKMEPRYKRLNDARAELAHQNKILAELKAQRVGAARWAEFMLMLQKTVPANIQLGHLYMAGGPQSGRLSIKGWSQGDDAEAVVIGWRKMLLGNSVYTNQFDSLDLGHLRLAGTVNEGEGVRRSFEFKGERRISSGSGGPGGQK